MKKKTLKKKSIENGHKCRRTTFSDMYGKKKKP